MPKQTEDKPLTAADLDALPTPEKSGSVRPGTIVGEGVAAEYEPFTHDWYLDVEARTKDPEFAGGYRLHEVMANETLDVSVNGVAFRLIAGRMCKLPTPHYMAYMDRLTRLKESQEMFTPPEGGPKPMTVYRIDGVWQKSFE